MIIQNAETAKEAAECYAAIEAAHATILKLDLRPRQRRLTLQVFGRKAKDEYYERTEEVILYLEGGDPMHAEIIEFALRRHVERLQAKINDRGRRLAQLGFSKPDICK